MSDNIKVVVKVRPLIRREIEDKQSLQWRVNNNALFQIDQNGKECGPVFTFDKVYDEETKTEDVYKDIAKPIVEAATAGFNGTIFAYGQTSSGKTYTMTGTDESPGIIPLAVLNLFDIIKNVPDRDFLVRVSYIEIYNETLIDLLNIEKQIKVHETFQGVKVNATEKVATSPEEVLEVMKAGKANRQTGSTNMNEESSRSHSIFQITIESREHIEGEEEVGSVNVSQLNLVDLAGSERAGQTGATGLRFKEGTHINKSLSVLALVIKQLSEDPNKHANYRDSKLTRILQNSLGGNAKTSIICAVTPAALEETISTLQFANRAKSIKNTPAVNAVATNASMIQSLTRQLSTLKTQLESKKHVEQDNVKLQKQITSLQRLILNGFGQSSADMLGGARRKQQNRRVTISTLHPIQEDAVSVAPTVPSPLSLNSLPEFAPIQSASSLTTVSEEPRLVTPPPRAVTICDDIIEIDSDEDSSLEVQTCSPYHGCYQSSKTPPCILRINAKKAEKTLKDLVQLTEREKLYTPNVVELMEQVENKSLKIGELEEKIIKLDDLSQKKDKEIEILKSKINDAEQNIKDIKSSLETACKTYATKLTDWEVSYETLQKKAKNREEELLSLLKEHESKKKNEKIGKISSMAIGKDVALFMDLSRDVSLVSSDNENSIINIEAKNPVLCTNNDTKNKLFPKEETIMQLEANLHAQNLKIESLENTNKKFQDMISDFKQKISFLENENTSQKSTIENLSRTIESQKSVNEMAKTDIESYKNVIEELNVKLSSKADISRDVNVIDIEAMIANEELFFASNDNIKNIILTLKTTLDLRNEEIKVLKSSLNNDSSENINSLQKELENKKREICLLLKEMESLKEDHVTEINNLLTIEQQLKTQLLETQALKNKEATDYLNKIEELTTCKENLNTELMKMQQDNENLQTEVRNLTQKVIILRNENTTKDNIIFEIQKKENALQVELSKVTSQLQNIIKLLSGKISEVPKMIDDLVAAFGTLTDNLASLEMIAKDIVKEKNDLITLAESNEKAFTKIKALLDDLDNAVNVFYKDGDSLNNTKTFENLQEGSHVEIESKLGNLMDKIKTTLEYLYNGVQNKDMEVNSIKLEYESKLTSESAKLLQEIQEITENRKSFLVNLLQKAKSVASQCDIECDMTSYLSSQIEGDLENNSYEEIVLIFDKIADHLLLLKSQKATENDRIHEMLSDARKEIYKLTEENRNLLNDISNLEKSNIDLSAETKSIQKDSKILASNLKESNTVLKELQFELLSKTSEIDIIENKAKEWKDKFTEHEMMMKEQIELLELENIDLKSKFSELNIQSKQSVPKTNLASGFQECHLTQSFGSPPSLTTICCNRIIKYIRLNENDNLESSSNATSTDLKYICQCTDLKADIDLLQKENSYLKIRIEQLEIKNDCLIKEQEEVQKEVQLLVETTLDLQKKVVNHRTNLSTLTATTYAENKSLTSQIKFLQHHHNRFHNVCQKDIPALKNQLQDLMVLLKWENNQGLNESLRPYSLPNNLDIIQYSTHSKFKNESILDGDLLMLDTNVTLTTCDNTLVGHDQSCLDVTQVCACNEVACQTSLNEVTNNDLLYSQMEMQPIDYIKIRNTLESLKAENYKLRDLVDEYSKNKQSSFHLVDAMSSPIKFQNTENVKILDTFESIKAENMKLRDLVDEYSKNKKLDIHLKNTMSSPIKIQNTLNEKDLSCHCNHEDKVQMMIESHSTEIGLLTKKLLDLEAQKQDIEQKYRDLTLEVPSTEHLVQKLSVLEKERCIKQTEIAKFTEALKSKNEEIKLLQEENDTLSTQVMESISELDDLKKEHDSLKEINIKLTEKCSLLGTEIEGLKHQDQKEFACTECKLKSELINHLETKLANNTQIKLDQSYSDHDNSSRCNKICSLQNELHAGKKDCIELKEEVTTIKKHLERSSHAMNLDVNIENSHMYSYNDFENMNTHNIKCDLPNIPHKSALFDLEREKCLNYYAEITGADKGSLSRDINLIDIMKTLYNYIQVKHANEVENLVNKLKDYEESKNALQKSLEDMKIESLKTTKELEEKNSYLHTMASVVAHVKNNIAVFSDSSYIQDIVFNFKDSFLKVIDKEFGLSSTAVFELVTQQLLDQNAAEIERLKSDKTKVEDEIQQSLKNLELVEERCKSLESQLTEKEKEFNLLHQQKEKVHEINATVTLDIVKKEQALRQLIVSGFRQLGEKKIVNEEIDFSLPASNLIELLFDLTLNLPKYNELLQKEKDHAIADINSLKSHLDIKNAELCTMTNRFTEAQEKSTNIQLDLIKKDEELKAKISQLETLNTVHSKTVEENDEYSRLIKRLTGQIEGLKATLQSKEDLVTSLESKLDAYNEKINVENAHKMSKLMETIAELQKETETLKAMNEVISKEKENYSLELEKACSTIKQNKIDLDKMTNDILMLRQTAKESCTVTQNLKKELDHLGALNKQLQEQVQEKCQNCSRLEMNIKTHEKAAQVQSRMIIRLQKQKEEDDRLSCEKDLKLDEMIQKCKMLEAECEKLTNDLKSSRDEVEIMRNGKLLLEARISDLEEELQSSKRRASFEATAETTRRRRQSIHDSRRMFADDNEDQAALISRPVTEESLMEVDGGESSSRSTPVLMHRGRDSLLSKHDQSDREEEHPRSSSVQASRRRRQSVHDMHRSVRLTPEPRENSRESSRNNSVDSEVTQLRKQLASCHKEIEELKEKCRELDEECETCAEYLRERDEQCLKLKREKRELEKNLAELKDKLNNIDSNGRHTNKRSFADAAVNTDEDWANLHSVVVDRMSFDAEVEKNKKLVKTIEELRFRKQELKMTMAKMQKALDRYSGRDKELEATRASLAACEREVSELRARCRELDDECEACAAHLRERDDQCRRLREAKAALEAKLQECSEAEAAVQSLRKKRQALHDQRRAAPAASADAATETSDDLLSYQVERDNNRLAAEEKHSSELKRLKMALEKLSQQKSELEQQLSTAPHYVATGSAIVQNQQITDVLKENQKLKKMNAKLVSICKKRGKALMDSNRENEQPLEQFNI